VAGAVTGHAPDRQRGAVRLHAADTIGAWWRRQERPRAGRSPARADAPLLEQVAINCVARLSEVDDIHLGAITPGAIVVPRRDHRGVAAEDRCTDLAAAIVAGYEARIRLGAAIDGPSVLYRGIWPSHFAARSAPPPSPPCCSSTRRRRRMRLPRRDHGARHWPSRGGDHGALARGRPGRHAGRAGAVRLHLRFSAGRRLPENIYGIVPDATLLEMDEPALSQVSWALCAARQTMAATQALKELAEGVAFHRAHRRRRAAAAPEDDRSRRRRRRPLLASHQPAVSMALAALMPDAAYGLRSCWRDIARAVGVHGAHQGAGGEPARRLPAPGRMSRSRPGRAGTSAP
jgi:hypothetical protein